MIKKSSKVSIPVFALGGALNINEFRYAYLKAIATGLAAGSMFVFHGERMGVLINYLKNMKLILINLIYEKNFSCSKPSGPLLCF